MSQLPPEVYNLIDAALSEDQTFSDPTTGTLVPPEIKGVGMLRAKAVGVLAGVDVASAVFQRVDSGLEVQTLLPDGSPLSPGDDIARVSGSAGSILRAERIALNFMQRMSGIASDTHRYVQAIQGCKARIVDTRKTVPGHRYLDKYSVRMGGGHNHRMNLADGILIKDNHIEALRSQEMGLGQVVQLALARASHTIKVEVEVETLEQLREALDAGAHIIMLDNMPVETMRQAMGMVNGRAVVEASGGINLETVRGVAETGVDLISIGGLTHSTTALDISLDLEFE
ncbi:MAG: carboxylating nicotinate-nucleotide diphosphorylase [Chloroflexi bacterium]|nr:carboxylating nicotinate-nucleotide diphosphorylase [Chloroflexota bacterium]MDA1219853.1 carboxylating nicotinate-nucleotide diphosphorylase [Chloroflexota bacterium]PKB57171.1 MAG: nicotinate-nucleotide diphosphorylase (carboxylating) [SAR202 cluster bacterium Casp-Chloro-G3]